MLYGSDPMTFRSTYSPVVVAVSNVQDLAPSRGIRPFLVRADNGSLWLIETPGSATLVFPKAGMVLSSGHVRFGALLSVFDAPDYRGGFRYRSFSVRTPAQVESASGGWQVVQQGQIDVDGEERED